MTKHFAPLQTKKLSAHASLHSHHKHAELLNEDSPAIKVMTDLRLVKAVTVDKNISIDAAHQLMIHRAIRLLFVVENEEFLGIVTAQDILGERPTKISFDQHQKYNEIAVHEIMTPKKEIVYVDLKSLEKASIGNLLPTIRTLNFQHLLVADSHSNAANIEQIVGIISTSQIARALGQSLATLKLPSSLYSIK